MDERLHLSLDLVPTPCWGKSLRKQLPRSKWNRLRKEVIAEQGESCRICGSSARLSCHEIWAYDDATAVQLLTGFEIVCGMCHHAAHLGNAEILAAQGQLDLDAVIEHFMTVNGVNRTEFERLREQAVAVWKARSARDWTTDYGNWASWLPDPA